MQRGARAMCAISRFLQRTEIAMRVEFANKASRGARGCFSEDFNFEFQHKPSWRRKDKIRSCRQVHHAPHVWGMLWHCLFLGCLAYFLHVPMSRLLNDGDSYAIVSALDIASFNVCNVCGGPLSFCCAISKLYLQFTICTSTICNHLEPNETTTPKTLKSAQ